jgi:hypothetical protein
MSLQRTEMRRCGKPYPTEEAAALHKRAQIGSAEPSQCRTGCPPGTWHLASVKAGEAPERKSSPGARPFPPLVADALDERDGCCQRCGSTRNLERHHRRLKASTGTRRQHTQCSCNGIVLCQKCHGWAHRGDRPAAEAQGFIVSQSVDEPASVGVMRFAAAEGGATQWPTCDGQWAGTAPEAREAVA